MVKKLELGHITIIGRATTNKKYYSFVSIMGPSLKQIKERCKEKREGGEEGGRGRERGRNEGRKEGGMREG